MAIFRSKILRNFWDLREITRDIKFIGNFAAVRPKFSRIFLDDLFLLFRVKFLDCVLKLSKFLVRRLRLWYHIILLIFQGRIRYYILGNVGLTTRWYATDGMRRFVISLRCHIVCRIDLFNICGFIYIYICIFCIHIYMYRYFLHRLDDVISITLASASSMVICFAYPRALDAMQQIISESHVLTSSYMECDRAASSMAIVLLTLDSSAKNYVSHHDIFDLLLIYIFEFSFS